MSHKPTILDFEPAYVNVKSVLGDKVEFTLTFQENGVAVDYSLFTFAATVKASSSGVTHTFTVDDTDSINGVVVLTLAAADCAELEQINDWDVQADDGSGPITLAGGQLLLLRQVS